MNRWVESLEGRRLMADAVQAAYAALLQDDANLRADATVAKTTFAAHRATLAADVRALPRSAANNRLLARVQATAGGLVASLTANTNRFANGIEPYYARVATYDALFAAHPTLALSRALRATQESTRTREGARVVPLQRSVATAGAPLAAALSALATANPGAAAAALLADVAAAMADQQAVVTTGKVRLAKVEADVTALTT